MCFPTQASPVYHLSKSTAPFFRAPMGEEKSKKKGEISKAWVGQENRTQFLPQPKIPWNASCAAPCSPRPVVVRKQLAPVGWGRCKDENARCNSPRIVAATTCNGVVAGDQQRVLGRYMVNAPHTNLVKRLKTHALPW